MDIRAFLFRLALLILLLSVGPAWAQLPTNPSDTPPPHPLVTIGIVRDGPSWAFDQLRTQIEKELTLLTKEEFQVVFKKIPNFDAGWDLNRVNLVLRNALDDPEVNIVLLLGLLVSKAAARESLSLPKPTIAGYILDTDLIEVPHDEAGHSLKKNFSFVATPHRVRNDIEAFNKLVDFKKLHIIADEKLLQGMEEMGKLFAPLEKKLDFAAISIPVGKTAEDALAKLDDKIKAIYLTPPLRMSMEERQALIDGINEKKISSFALRGLPDVQRGVLAGITPSITQRLARRIALNLQRIMLGDSMSELPSYLHIDEKLVINTETAMKIGYSPRIETLGKAEFLHEEVLEKGESLSLRQAMDIAAEQNIDLAIREAEVRISKQVRNKAMSRLLPQVGGDIRYDQIDSDRAEASLGSQSELESRLGFLVNQILFDDRVFSRYRASKRQYQRRRYEEDDLRLDIMELAATRFFDYLSARALLRIEKSNMELTQSNLDLARVRYRVGTGGREEVYRWEASLARDRSSVNQAYSALEAARVALNQTLGMDQNRRWRAKDIVLADDDYYFLDNRAKGLLKNTKDLAIFRNFAVEDAYRNSPGLKGIGEAIDAQKIILAQLKRRFVLPSFNAEFAFDHQVAKRDRGTDIGVAFTEAGLPAITFPRSDRDDWFLGLSASIPLFEGGGRYFDVARASADLDRLTNTRERIMQLIEEETRSTIYDIESSQPNIRLSRLAAERAHKNLDIVRNKYSHGIVSILDLLDAQNQALLEDKSAALAVYGYLNDIFAFQRAISWFAYTKSDEEKQEWVKQLAAFLKKSKEAKAPAPPR